MQINYNNKQPKVISNRSTQPISTLVTWPISSAFRTSYLDSVKMYPSLGRLEYSHTLYHHRFNKTTSPCNFLHLSLVRNLAELLIHHVQTVTHLIHCQVLLTIQLPFCIENVFFKEEANL